MNSSKQGIESRERERVRERERALEREGERFTQYVTSVALVASSDALALASQRPVSPRSPKVLNAVTGKISQEQQERVTSTLST